jgi:hypothetical protein
MVNESDSNGYDSDYSIEPYGPDSDSEDKEELAYQELVDRMDSVGGKLRQDKNPHKVHQSAKRDLTAKQ